MPGIKENPALWLITLLSAEILPAKVFGALRKSAALPITLLPNRKTQENV
jgi:hypothetical protein